jgi:hypothetical protein
MASTVQVTLARDTGGAAWSHAGCMASITTSASGIGFGASPGSALAVSASGMQTAAGRLDADSRTIASQGPDVGSMVDVDVQTATYAALATVIRATGEMTRSTIDLLA